MHEMKTGESGFHVSPRAAGLPGAHSAILQLTHHTQESAQIIALPMHLPKVCLSPNLPLKLMHFRLCVGLCLKYCGAFRDVNLNYFTHFI